MDFPILSTIILLPLLGVLLLATVFKKEPFNKIFALFVTLMELGVVLYVQALFDPSVDAWQFVEKYEWLRGYNIYYYLAIDGISLNLLLLTAVLIPMCLLASWNSVKHSQNNWLALFLALESIIMGTFTAMDLLLFYLFFEASLIPLFLIIGIWGGSDRFYASFKFFLYTFFGSVFMLLAIMYIYINSGTTDIYRLYEISSYYTLDVQKWLWLAFFIAFAIKIPMWPLHTWLPDAHVQAPTAGSMVLAGILLKLGCYGFIRILLPMFPEASNYFADWMIILGIIAVLYTSLVALAQTDIKKTIAYSSVAHMGYVTAALFTFNIYGIQGAVFQMISHGIVSAALFFCIGIIHKRTHTREMKKLGGLVNLMPKFAFLFMVMMMASIGLPGTSGFVGEFLTMFSVYRNSLYQGLAIAFGMVLGAAYMLTLYYKVMYGKVNKAVPYSEISDLNVIEKYVLWTLGIITILLGVYPSIVTSYVGNYGMLLIQ